MTGSSVGGAGGGGVEVSVVELELVVVVVVVDSVVDVVVVDSQGTVHGGGMQHVVGGGTQHGGGSGGQHGGGVSGVRHTLSPMPTPPSPTAVSSPQMVTGISRLMARELPVSTPSPLPLDCTSSADPGPALRIPKLPTKMVAATAHATFRTMSPYVSAASSQPTICPL